MGSKKPQQNAPPELWERQPGEGTQAFRAFAAYRDSGADNAKRSLQKTANSLTKSNGEPYSVGTLKEWSRKWKWQMRVDAWDAELDRQVRQELKKGITGMRKNHVDIAQAMLVQALKALKSIPTEEISPRDVVTMVDVAAKLERLSRGEVTERTEDKKVVTGEIALTQQIDFSNVSDEELAMLDEIINKVYPE